MPISRRDLLRGLGGAAALLPLLDATRARAAGGPPRRFVAILGTTGTIAPQWNSMPGTSETAFTLSPILKPLERHKAKLLILKGVWNECGLFGIGDEHHKGPGQFLTGVQLADSRFGGGISIDQEMVKRGVGAGTKFASLHFACHFDTTMRGYISYLGAKQQVPNEPDPAKAFNRLFAGQVTDPAEADRLRARRKSILDALTAQFNTLSAKVGTEDRRKLDAHLTAIRDIETRLETAGGGGTCARPGQPPVKDWKNMSNLPEYVKLQLDIIAAALACGLTQIVTFMPEATGESGNHTFPFLSVPDRHHELSHYPESNEAAKTKLAKVETWYSEQIAYFLDKLNAVSEGTGTLLDNTLVFYGNELGKGNNHSFVNIPIVLAGSCGGYFKTARFVDFGDKGARLNDLLVSCLNAMDVPATTFGDPRFCKGPMPKLT